MKQALLILVASLSAVCVLIGQNTAPDSLKQYQLFPIRVVADLPEQTIGGVVVKPILRGETDSSMNLREVFENIPGISSTYGSKDESNLRLRGFRKNEVKIMVDGRPLNSGYFGNVDLNNISLADIKDVVVIKGPASSLYGTGTMGGVVNLITRDPSRDTWIKLGVTAKRNNTNLFELGSAHSFDAWNYHLYASRENTDGIVVSGSFEPTGYENGGVRNNSHKTAYTLNGGVNFDFLDYHELGFTAGVTYIGRKEIPSSIFESKYRLYRDWQKSQATAMGVFRLDPVTSLNTMFYYDNASDHYFEYNDPHYQYLSVDSMMKNYTLGFNPRLDWQSSDATKFSFGYRGEIFTSNRKDNGNYLTWTGHQMMLHQLFGQMEHSFGSKLKTTGSLGIVSSTSDLVPKPDWHFEPAVGIYYEPNRQSTLSLSCGYSTAYPTMRQQFSYEHGNPDLKPQTAIKSEFGVSRQVILLGKDVSLGGSLYYNRTRDLIDEYQNLYQNIYRVDSYGGELNLMLKPLPRLEAEASYAYLSYRQDSDYRLTESPQNSAEFKVNYQLPLQLVLYYSASYKDIRYSQDSAGRYRVLDAYWVHNLQLSRKWKAYRVYFGLENIFDTDYQSEWGFPEAGINFNVGCQIEL
ncbi:MAG TPA: TonB-dependent receptor [Candidatus Cloacimonadota bacterium]|nr:TonB-dependent receptor [Candidatus Cloacimonadota bacterium]